MCSVIERFDLEASAKKKLDFKELLPGYSVGALILLVCERMNQTGSVPPAPSIHQLRLPEYEPLEKTKWEKFGVVTAGVRTGHRRKE